MSHASADAFPKLPDGSIDRKKLKQEYLESDEINWIRFCEKKGYPWNHNHVYYGAWVRDKKKREEWKSTAIELSEKIGQLEPSYAKRTMQVLETMPNTFFALWGLVNLTTKSYVDKKEPIDADSLNKLAQSARVISECMLKFLGIDNVKKAIEEMDRKISIAEETEVIERTTITVETLKSSQMEMTIQDAFEKYVDKPARGPEI